jgi:hypothetical protein
MFYSAYELIYLRFLREKIEKKFYKFLEFCKTIEVNNFEDENKNINTLENIDNLSSIDYKFYEILYKGGVITKEEFRSYITKEKAKINSKTTLNFEVKTIYVEPILRKAVKLYFGIDDETWNKVEPLFYVILERDLDMNEDDIYAYINLVTNIEANPVQASNYIVNRLKTLKEFRNIKDIRNVIGNVSLNDKETLSKSLLKFLLEVIEKIRKSKKKSEELKKNATILKAIMELSLKKY